jgi:hypothetical protein
MKIRNYQRSIECYLTRIEVLKRKIDMFKNDDPGCIEFLNPKKKEGKEVK